MMTFKEWLRETDPEFLQEGPMDWMQRQAKWVVPAVALAAGAGGLALRGGSQPNTQQNVATSTQQPGTQQTPQSQPTQQAQEPEEALDLDDEVAGTYQQQIMRQMSPETVQEIEQMGLSKDYVVKMAMDITQTYERSGTYMPVDFIAKGLMQAHRQHGNRISYQQIFQAVNQISK